MNKRETFFLRQGDAFKLTNDGQINITKTLPLGHYTIMATLEGYIIVPIPEVKTEAKLYGNVNARAERIINTFKDRSQNTGVLLEGEKGSGKTLLGRTLAAKLAHEHGVSSFIINQALAGEAFNNLISSIEQPMMIMWDEFEKVYDQETQQKLLTLLDGTYTHKKLFVVTVNDGYRVVDYMKNRPGRMFYKFTYGGLDSEFIREYAEDNLKNKKNIDGIVNTALTFDKFNFDTLKAMVEEMNRYNETAGDVLNYLNANPTTQNASYEVVEITPKDIPEHINDFDKTLNDGMPLNPFASNAVMWLYGRPKKEKVVEVKDSVIIKNKKKSRDDFYIEFQTKDITEIKNGKFTVENNTAKMVFARKVREAQTHTWRDLL